MSKSVEAFRTIGEVAEELEVPKHVLRFWEGKFPHIKPMKRGGGRRYYRPEDMELLRGIRHLLHAEGYTIKGVQKILRQQGVDQVKAAAAASAALAANVERQSKSRKKPAAVEKRVPAVSGKPVAVAAKAAADGSHQNSTTTNNPAAGNAAVRKNTIAAAIRELEFCRQLLIAGGAKSTGQATPVLRAARS